MLLTALELPDKPFSRIIHRFVFGHLSLDSFWHLESASCSVLGKFEFCYQLSGNLVMRLSSLDFQSEL